MSVPTTEVECPSGLVVALRKFKVSDEDLLVDRKAVKKGLAITNLLGAITQSVIDPGLYSLTDKGLIDWQSVLQGDILTILLKNRIATWGADANFRTSCQNCPEIASVDVDLNEFPIQQLPESSHPHVSQNVPIRVRLMSGPEVSFRLLRGKDERALQKLQKEKGQSLSSAYLRFRVIKIEGVADPEIQAYLRDLDGDEAAYLRAAFDQADCGVDQEIEFSCDDCGFRFNEDVKFRSDFLFPKYRKKITTSA